MQVPTGYANHIELQVAGVAYQYICKRILEMQEPSGLRIIGFARCKLKMQEATCSYIEPSLCHANEKHETRSWGVYIRPGL